MTGLRNIRQRRRRRQKKMSTKTTTTTMESLEEDRRHVQDIGDNDRGGNGLTTGPVDLNDNRVLLFLAIAFLTVKAGPQTKR